MKKRVLLLCLLVLIAVLPAVAQQGSLKVGALLGYPTTATLGYGLSDSTEINGYVGYTYGFGSYYGGLYVGANMLFNILDVNLGGEILPLSIGPQVGLIVGGGQLSMDVLGDIRWEYTFRDIPLNLFLELGLGARINFSHGGIGFSSTGGLGVRYVF